jgi:hypothetical protein
MTANPDDDLAGSLCSLFLAAAEAAAQRVRQLGWPLTRPVTQTSIRRDRRNPAAWSSQEREVEQSISAHPGTPLHQLAPLLTPEAAVAASDCASTLVATAGANLPFWSSFEGRGWLLTGSASGTERPSADYSTDPTDWTARHLLLPALYEQLAALPSLDAVVANDGRRFATDVLRVATADHLAYRVTAPLGGLDIRGPSGTTLTSGEGTIRRLSGGYYPSGYAAYFRPDPSWVMPISMSIPLLCRTSHGSGRRLARRPSSTSGRR